MSTSSTRTESSQTKTRKVRKLLLDLMAEAGDLTNDVPAICRRVRELRESITDEETGKKLSQEKAASLLGLTLKGYSAYEHHREPTRARLREIAVAFGQPADYFERAEISEEVREAVREELLPLLDALRRLEARLQDEEDPPLPDEVP